MHRRQALPTSGALRRTARVGPRDSLVPAVRRLEMLAAAHPAHRGAGGALLREVLQETDAAGLGVVLVASADRLVPWYVDHGFRSAAGENPRVMYR